MRANQRGGVSACHGHAWEAWHTPVARGIHSPSRAQGGGRRDVHLDTTFCQTIVSRLLDNEQETPVQNSGHVIGNEVGTDCANLEHSNWEAPEAQLLAPMHAILVAYARKVPRAQVFGLYPSQICDFWSSEFRAPFCGVLKKLGTGPFASGIRPNQLALAYQHLSGLGGRLLWCL